MTLCKRIVIGVCVAAVMVSAASAQITITKVVNGNYAIRRVN